MAQAGNSNQAPPADAGDYRGHELLAVSVIFAILDTIFAIARYISRRIVKEVPLGVDDYLIMPSYICCLGMCVLGFVFVYKCQVGYHVDAAVYHDPEALMHWGKTVWGLNYIWLSACAFPKLSILALYKRIFTDKWTTRITWVLIWTVIATWSGMCLAALMQCIPVAAFWDKSIKGKCFNIDLYFKLGNLPIIITDIPIMLLPFPSLWNLHASIAKKLGLTFIFICGGLGVVASLIRFVLFEEHNAFTDNTWASVDLVGWSIIEPSMYLIASCLLSIKPLVQRIGELTSRRLYTKNRLSNCAEPHSIELSRLTTVPPSQSCAAGIKNSTDSSIVEVDGNLTRQTNKATRKDEAVNIRTDIWVERAPRSEKQTTSELSR